MSIAGLYDSFGNAVAGEENERKSFIYFIHVPKPAIGRLELHKKAIHSNNN